MVQNYTLHFDAYQTDGKIPGEIAYHSPWNLTAPRLFDKSLCKLQGDAFVVDYTGYLPGEYTIVRCLRPYANHLFFPVRRMFNSEQWLDRRAHSRKWRMFRFGSPAWHGSNKQSHFGKPIITRKHIG